MKKAIEKNGKIKQSVIAMEECSELIKAISKMIRYSSDEDSACVFKDDLIEEMADVYIILDELKIMYDILEFEIDEIMKLKMLREEGRIRDEEIKKEEGNDEKFIPEGTIL